MLFALLRHGSDLDLLGYPVPLSRTVNVHDRNRAVKFARSSRPVRPWLGHQVAVSNDARGQARSTKVPLRVKAFCACWTLGVTPW